MDEHFPNLATEGFTVTSAESGDYNCVAWAAGDVVRWWWPDPMELSHWPEGVLRQPSLAAFQDAFSGLGYSPTKSQLREWLGKDRDLRPR